VITPQKACHAFLDTIQEEERAQYRHPYNMGKVSSGSEVISIWPLIIHILQGEPLV
jgi:hypothetical protein